MWTQYTQYTTEYILFPMAPKHLLLWTQTDVYILRDVWGLEQLFNLDLQWRSLLSLLSPYSGEMFCWLNFQCISTYHCRGELTMTSTSWATPSRTSTVASLTCRRRLTPAHRRDTAFTSTAPSSKIYNIVNAWAQTLEVTWEQWKQNYAKMEAGETHHSPEPTSSLTSSWLQCRTLPWLLGSQ